MAFFAKDFEEPWAMPGDLVVPLVRKMAMYPAGPLTTVLFAHSPRQRTKVHREDHVTEWTIETGR